MAVVEAGGSRGPMGGDTIIWTQLQLANARRELASQLETYKGMTTDELYAHFGLDRRDQRTIRLSQSIVTPNLLGALKKEYAPRTTLPGSLLG